MVQNIRSNKDKAKHTKYLKSVPDRLKVEKYADFYEGGAMLLEDPRPKPTKDFELVFLFHSESPTASTVPLSIIKLHYEGNVLSDKTKIKYRDQ